MRVLFVAVVTGLVCVPVLAEDAPAEAERALSCGALFKLVAAEVAETDARDSWAGWISAAGELTEMGKAALAERGFAPERIESISGSVNIAVVLSQSAEAEPKYSMDECILQLPPRGGGWEWSRWGMTINQAVAFAPQPLRDAPPQTDPDVDGLSTRFLTATGGGLNTRYEVRLRFDSENRLQEVVMVPEDFSTCADMTAGISLLRPLQISNIFGMEYRLWRHPPDWSELTYISMGADWCSIAFRSMSWGAQQRLLR